MLTEEEREAYRKRALEIVGIPAKFFGSSDPYKEDTPILVWEQIKSENIRAYKKIDLNNNKTRTTITLNEKPLLN